MENLQHKISKYRNKYILLLSQQDAKDNHKKEFYKTNQKHNSCKYFLYF